MLAPVTTLIGWSLSRNRSPSQYRSRSLSLSQNRSLLPSLRPSRLLKHRRWPRWMKKWMRWLRGCVAYATSSHTCQVGSPNRWAMWSGRVSGAT
jgi:hypothetical protein